MRLEWASIVVAAIAATSWLVVYWTGTGLKLAWRTACAHIVDGILGMGHVQVVDNSFTMRALRALSPVSEAESMAGRKAIVIALSALDKQELREVNSKRAIQRWLGATVGRVARESARFDLAKRDIVLSVFGSDAQDMTKGAYAMVGGLDFERANAVTGLLRVIAHGPAEDRDNHVLNVEPLIDEPSQLDQLRRAIEAFPEDQSKIGRDVLMRVAARFSD